MPEHWIPFGHVEELATIQAENLGSVIDPAEEKAVGELDRLAEEVKGASRLLVCDSNPTTIEVVRGLSDAISSSSVIKVTSPAPRMVESVIPELKSKVSTLPPPVRTGEETEPMVAQGFEERGKKLFVGTAKPDPFYGIIDAKIGACMNWVVLPPGRARKTPLEPAPFHKTSAYERMEQGARNIEGASFWTVLPRSGKPRAVLEDAPFDAIKNGFLDTSLPPTKAAIIGAGGRGYDDTLSSSIRSAWSALPSVKKSGSILLVAECSEGLGSTALEMLATGRVRGDSKSGAPADGLEDVFYLNKLKQEYDVLLLSGLPEVYAKSKLGLTTARGSGEAVGRLLNKVGRSGKINVVTRAPECRVRSG